MPKKGPILLVEDDIDDQQLIVEIIHNSVHENPVRIFSNGKEAYDYLLVSTKRHFLIISDVNMPVMNGIELKQQINKNADLMHRCIPFIFLTTTKDSSVVKKAFEMSVQGFFKKPSSYEELKLVLESTLDYWKLCEYPEA